MFTLKDLKERPAILAGVGVIVAVVAFGAQFAGASRRIIIPSPPELLTEGVVRAFGFSQIKSTFVVSKDPKGKFSRGSGGACLLVNLTKQGIPSTIDWSNQFEVQNQCREDRDCLDAGVRNHPDKFKVDAEHNLLPGSWMSYCTRGACWTRPGSQDEYCNAGPGPDRLDGKPYRVPKSGSVNVANLYRSLNTRQLDWVTHACLNGVNSFGQTERGCAGIQGHGNNLNKRTWTSQPATIRL